MHPKWFYIIMPTKPPRRSWNLHIITSHMYKHPLTPVKIIENSRIHRWKATRSTRPKSSCTTYRTVRRAAWSCSSTRATAACWRCTPSSSVVASKTSWSYRPLAWTIGHPGTLSTRTWESPAGPPVCQSTSRWVVSSLYTYSAFGSGHY